MSLASVLSFRTWSLAGFDPPWSGPSLYVHIQAHGGTSDLPEKGDLGSETIRWSAGALDGVMSHHGFEPDKPGTEQTRRKIVRSLATLLKRATSENLGAFCGSIQWELLLAEVEELEMAIRARFLPRYKPQLAQVGRYLAVRGDDREIVKFGIVLIRISGDQSDIPILELLATHDEFTLYAATALATLAPDPEEALWQAAKRVHGWGRVQVVERLAGTKNRDIQAWMLRDGFRNQVMNEYLAFPCADTGKLHEALSASQIDRALLDGAADILRALVAGGPAESIDDYRQAPEAVRAYLLQVEQVQVLGLRHLLCLASLKGFLSEEECWQERLANGWTGHLRQELRLRCAQAMDRPEWIALIQAGLRSDDLGTFFEADSAARELGINTWDIHFEKVRAAPLKSHSWFRLLQQTTEEQIDQILLFAEGAFPLERLSSGPTDSLGLGLKYEVHRAFGWILQELRRFPERGWILIRAGLQSPVVGNRNMALNAFLKWPRASWPEEAHWVIGRAFKAEPNEALRKRLGDCMQGRA